jgi:hypothetical protein
MPSFLADALQSATSPVFWVVMLVILAGAAIGYALLRKQLGPSAAADENSKVIQDWLPTGRIDFAGPSTDPSAADTPASFYLQAEETRMMISLGGIERREIRWRRATLNEAKRVVSMFHRQLPKSSLRPVEKDAPPPPPAPPPALADEAPADAKETPPVEEHHDAAGE